MAHIRLDRVSLRYPLLDMQAAFLRNQIAKWLSLGLLRHRAGLVRQIQALKGVCLELREGDRVGLAGQNGAGKSTLLRTMAGIYRPQEGQVDVQGSVATMLDIEAGVDPELTGRENTITLGLIMGLPLAQCRAIVPTVAEFSGLGTFYDIPTGAYSTGMRMRLVFSVATAVTPDILLLDEWFSTGDAQFQQKSLSRLNQIDQTRITVLASHDPGLLRRYCNRFFLLDHGSVQEVHAQAF